MRKVQVGDYVFVDHYGQNGFVIGDRGGRVAPWLIKLDNGEVGYASSRDAIVIKGSRPEPIVNRGRLTTDEKLNMLMDYLGLEIKDEPEIVKKEEESDESA